MSYEHLNKICGAKTKSGKECGARPMPNGRCRIHGGASPSGPASPHFKHGGRSKYMPKRLLETYEEALDDPKLMEYEQDLALIETRLVELMQALNSSSGASETWKQLTDLWTVFMHAVRSGNGPLQTELLPQLNAVVKDGGAAVRTWEEMLNLVERRRRVLSANDRRLELKNQTITVEQAMMAMTAMVLAIKESVHRYADPGAAKHILVDVSNQYKRIVGPPEGAPANTRSDR